MREKMRLLIGYDGSKFANAALDDLSRAGLPRDAEAIILTVSELWLSLYCEQQLRSSCHCRISP